MRTAADDLIRELGLQAHPEGGHYRETYRSPATFPWRPAPDAPEQPRAFATGIYYLLAAGQVSKLHRLSSDEMWHFYAGDPLVIVSLHPGGIVRETRLGLDIPRGETPQHVVPAGTWFGAYVPAGSLFTLTGCTVSPGFTFADLEWPDPEALRREWPGAEDLIRRLT